MRLCSRYANILSLNVIARRAIREYGEQHADAADELLNWYAVASKSIWASLIDVHLNFKDADQVGRVLIFNVRHNTYRLIVKVDYAAKFLMVKAFLTHKNYMKDGWKKWC